MSQHVDGLQRASDVVHLAERELQALSAGVHTIGKRLERLRAQIEVQRNSDRERAVRRLLDAAIRMVNVAPAETASRAEKEARAELAAAVKQALDATGAVAT